MTIARFNLGKIPEIAGKTKLGQYPAIAGKKPCYSRDLSGAYISLLYLVMLGSYSTEYYQASKCFYHSITKVTCLIKDFNPSYIPNCYCHWSDIEFFTILEIRDIAADQVYLFISKKSSCLVAKS